MEKRESIAKMFWAFVKIGALTFGGGYSMLPMLERECVDKTGWATQEELLEYFAIGQCTPGVIAVNTATFVGIKLRGVVGAIATTAGVVTPSIIIISLIAALLSNFSDVPAVQYAFSGIRVAVSALIVNAVIGLCKKSIKNVWGILLSVVGFALVACFGTSPVWVVLGAGLFGIVKMYIDKGAANKSGEKEEDK